MSVAFLKILILNVIMLSAVMLNVIVMSVMAPERVLLNIIYQVQQTQSSEREH